MRRRIAKRQVLALYAGIVMGLKHLDEEQKKLVTKVTADWEQRFYRQMKDPENPAHFPSLRMKGSLSDDALQ
eukprot:10550588-Alexandrium_andersonii.AAC.1